MLDNFRQKKQKGHSTRALHASVKIQNYYNKYKLRMAN